jgi:hypothetical protein
MYYTWNTLYMSNTSLTCHSKRTGQRSREGYSASLDSAPIQSNPIQSSLIRAMQALNPRRLIQGHTKHTSVHLLVLVGYISSWQLTMLSPKIMLHQKRTLFNRVRPLTHLLRCSITIGI